MKKKYLAAVILMLAIVFALNACGGKDSGSDFAKGSESSGTGKDETSVTPELTKELTPTVTPTPTVTSTPTPTPIPPIDHDGHEKKRELNCIKDKGMALEINDAGEDRMLVSIFTKEMCYDENGVEAGTKVRYCLVDTKNDEIAAETISESAAETFIGLRENGDIIVYDHVFRRILVYSKELKIVKELPLETSENIVYDSKKDVLYTIIEANLVCIDMEGNKKVLLEKTVETDITGSSYCGDRLIFSDPGFYSYTDKAYSVYDVENGKLESVFNKELLENIECDSFVLGLSDTEEDGALISVYDFEKKEEGPTYKYESRLYKGCETDFPLAVVYRQWFDSNNDLIKEFLLVKPEDGSYGKLEDFSSFDVVAAEDAKTEHLYFVATTYPGGKPVNLFYEYCPECFDFSEKLEEAEVKEEEHTEEKCGDYLAEIRKKADEIEKEYGVEILIGNEIKSWTINTYYELISTEDMYEGEKEIELGDYEYTLEILEQALKQYPKGFFDIFKDYRNVGGMRFVLVGDLKNNGGSFVAGGVSSDVGCWRNIVFDIDVPADSTPHHEIWHSVEAQIKLRDPEAFSDEEWGALNPEGFKYIDNFDKYIVDSMKYDEYILMRSFGETPGYFIEAYSTVNGQEDRATLIEPVMTDDIFLYEEGTYPSSKAYVESFPALNAKLSYMEEQYEKWFGEKYW